MAMMQFELFGEEHVRVDTAVVYVDHNILQIDFKNPDDHRFLQAMAAKYGAWFSRPGNGICHYVHCERFAKPGQTLIGADSHTTQSGSCAMIAIGAGGLDVAVCMAGHPFELPCPKIVGVFLENELARPVDPGEGRDPRVAAPPRASGAGAAACSSSPGPASAR
jgi:aconitate hydratase